MTTQRTKAFFPWFLLVMLLIALGCGGGGGGTVTNYNLSGFVINIETGSDPDPVATVRVGENAVLTDSTDGFFNILVPPNTTSLTVTYTPTGGSPIVRSFSFAGITADTDLGDLFVGPEEVTLTGTVQDSTTNQGLSGVTLKIAGRQAISASDGSFSIPGVAYSSNTQTVFFGLQGIATKTNYFQANFSPTSTPVNGIVGIGTISMTPVGGTTPPPLPTNVNGSTTPANAAIGGTVEILSGTTVIRTTIIDGLGQFKVWLPAGTYTARVTSSGASGTSNFTVTNVNSQISITVPVS
ncbi:MAG: hypothetical protein KDC26_05290 [Armatimonadetes bacterium]|nr:hypothetical protein [Armatimonadota bacterium]